MSLQAPLRVPIELRLDGRSRWYRLTQSVSENALHLGEVVPEELDRPLLVAFHLPGDPVPIRCRGETVEVVVGPGAERRGIRFLDLDAADQTRVSSYVQIRLGLVP